MAKKQKIFRLNDHLEQQFADWCTNRGLVQENMLELLVFMLCEKNQP